MPAPSKTGNVRKVCGCDRWNACPHAWYVWYKAKGRQYRKNLDVLIGRHCADLEDAKIEARRAIVAWEEGRDVAELLAGDRPTIATLLEAYHGRAKTPAKHEAAKIGPITRTLVAGRPFGQHRADQVTRHDLEAFRRVRPPVGANRDLALLRAAYNYAVLGGVLTATPFKVGTVTAVKMAREEARTRRFQPGEEARLLAACESALDRRGKPLKGNLGCRQRLRDVIIAALESGCRIGELLSLQWAQVRGDLFLPAGKTKSKKPRRVPISSTLADVLASRRLDPNGDPLPPEAYVFGDEIGRRRVSIDEGFRLACRRAGLVDLHLHDLRREAGSRWMDAGVPIATIQRWLGHHNISQTSTYLAASGGDDSGAMRAFEERIGRVAPLPQNAPNGVPEGQNGSESDPSAAENPNKNAKVQKRHTVH